MQLIFQFLKPVTKCKILPSQDYKFASPSVFTPPQYKPNVLNLFLRFIADKVLACKRNQNRAFCAGESFVTFLR